MRAVRARRNGGCPPGRRAHQPRQARTGPARVGIPHGKNAAQDAHCLRLLPRPHPRKPRREHGISHWRAQCIQRCPLGSEEGCAEKAHARSPGVGCGPAGPGSDLSEELVVGVEPVALDVRVAPGCPPGPAACAVLRSSAIMIRQTWSARRRLRQRMASLRVLPSRSCGRSRRGRGCRACGPG